MKSLALVLFAGSLCAQTTTPTEPTPATIPGLPSYFMAIGGGYSPTASVKTAGANAEGWVSASLQIGKDSPYYSVTTIDMTGAANTMRTGVARVMAQSGSLTMLARVDAGISTPLPTIASFSGGAIFMYKLPKLTGWYAIAEARITANPAGPAGAVNLGMYVGIGRSF